MILFDGHVVVSAFQKISIYTPDGKKKGDWVAHQRNVDKMTASAEGNIWSCSGNEIRIWRVDLKDPNFSSPPCIHMSTIHTAPITTLHACTFDVEGQTRNFVFTCSLEKNLLLWDASSLTPITEFLFKEEQEIGNEVLSLGPKDSSILIGSSFISLSSKGSGKLYVIQFQPGDLV